MPRWAALVNFIGTHIPKVNRQIVRGGLVSKKGAEMVLMKAGGDKRGWGMYVTSIYYIHARNWERIDQQNEKKQEKKLVTF